MPLPPPLLSGPDFMTWPLLLLPHHLLAFVLVRPHLHSQRTFFFKSDFVTVLLKTI